VLAQNKGPLNRGVFVKRISHDLAPRVNAIWNSDAAFSTVHRIVVMRLAMVTLSFGALRTLHIVYVETSKTFCDG
jgi:hypothetical protein